MEDSNYKLVASRLPPETVAFLKKQPNISQYIREAIILKRSQEQSNIEEKPTASQLSKRFSLILQQIKTIKQSEEYKRASETVTRYHTIKDRIADVIPELQRLSYDDKLFLQKSAPGYSKGYAITYLHDEVQLDLYTANCTSSKKPDGLKGFLGRFNVTADDNTEAIVCALVDMLEAEFVKPLDKIKDYQVQKKILGSFNAEIVLLEAKKAELEQQIIHT